ncbi:MAG: prephenate dehydratase [Thermodesulfovibrionales bacterium]|nr:prephenate dehydratase [Thermodesulfovibrionales bacterium]
MKRKHSVKDIERLREKIDAIDSELVEMLNRRAEIVIEIANIKKALNLKFYSPERERAILNRIVKLNKGPFPNDALKFIFREILSATLSLEQPLKVAYLGPEGTFTHLAAIRHFGSSANYMPVESIKATFDAVENTKADFGLVPIENSNEGVVSYTLDMFMDYDLKIAAEIMLEISHNLVSKSGDREKIKKIYSHPQATAQCRIWLERNMPGIPIFEATSTSRAAEIASKDEDSAAIASELAAKIYDLNFVEKHIEDNKKNYTRFLVISKDFPSRTGNDKTSILFSLRDRPGALYESLQPFKEANINLNKIESRPSKRRAWEYIFFIDMEGHIEDQKVTEAIEKTKEICLYLKHLGSYPADKSLER